MPYQWAYKEHVDITPQILGSWWPMHTATCKVKGTAAKRPFCKQDEREQQCWLDKPGLLNTSVQLAVLSGRGGV